LQLEGIVSQDLGDLLIGLLYKSSTSKYFRTTFSFILKFFFTLNFLKMASIRGCASALDFSQEEAILWSNLLLCGSRTPEELLSGAPFLPEVKYRLLEHGSHFGWRI
jgi:hypothetical protein